MPSMQLPVNKSAFIVIGNSDDKLSQSDWAKFQGDLDGVGERLEERGETVHGIWFSEAMSPYQNMCLCVTVQDDSTVEWLTNELAEIAAHYDQDSIAIQIDYPTFVEAKE